MKRLGKVILGVFLGLLGLLYIKNEYAWKLGSHTYGIPGAIQMQQIDHLFIGSSMFRQGLDIQVIEQELEGNSYILSYNGNQPAFMAMELEYLLDAGVEIENLYIDLYAFTACASPWISDTKMFLDTDLDFKIQVCRLLNEEQKVSFSQYYEIFVTANNEQLLTFPINEKIVSSQFYHGGTLLDQSGKTEEELDALDLGVREGLHETQIAGYEKILDLAEEYEIQVVFIETPKYEKLCKDTRKGAYPELLEACTKAVEDLGGTVFLAEDTGFDNSRAAGFQDLIHFCLLYTF